MIKKVAAIVVFIMVASLSLAGCVIKFTPTPMPVPTPVPTTTHNPILESAANQWMSGEPLGWVHYGKKETWNGGNSVTIFFIERAANNYTKNISAYPTAANYTFMVFATTQDATRYIDSLDKSQYLWEDAPFSANLTDTPNAIRALGTPSVFQHWYYIEWHRTPNEKLGAIIQYDNIVQVETFWALS